MTKVYGGEGGLHKMTDDDDEAQDKRLVDFPSIFNALIYLSPKYNN